MSQQPIRPPRLRPGARVALIAPSGPILQRDDAARAEALCRELGWTPVRFPHALKVRGWFGGTDMERLADLNAALADPSIDAVWCLRGGDGMNRIVDRVDTAGFAKAPKPVIGYSDITVLLLALWHATGVISFHAPLGREPMPEFAHRHFTRVLQNPSAPGLLELPSPPAGVRLPTDGRVAPVVGGRATGRLLGGNLTLVQSLLGTRHLPSFDGAILFLEDIDEDLYRIDRMLAHCRLTGAFDRLGGVAIGQFSNRRDHTPDGALSYHEILEDHFGPLGIPVAAGFPIGHIDAQWTIPVGCMAELDADAGTLALLESAVS